jgi:lipopolysaccharide export system protein LptA
MNMKKLIVVLFALGVVLAAGTRVITIKGRFTGDLTNGPYTFRENPVATVQKLTINAKEAVLSAPAGMKMSEAQEKRTALFSGGTTATRGRLTANGPTLEYKEATGLGVLAGPVSIKITPEKQGDDTVTIQASKATFDVDTNVSTSESSVRLVNGGQTATASKVVYDEQTDLGCLTDSRTVQLVREPKKAGDPRLIITAKETRVNTKTNTIVALGGVRLEAGDNVTTGDALFYDDTKDTAWVVGNLAKKLEAKNVNKKSGTTISGGTIINYTRRNTVQLQGGIYKVPLDKFFCPSSK